MGKFDYRSYDENSSNRESRKEQRIKYSHELGSRYIKEKREKVSHRVGKRVWEEDDMSVGYGEG